MWTEKDAAIAVIDDLCRRCDVPIGRQAFERRRNTGGAASGAIVRWTSYASSSTATITTRPACQAIARRLNSDFQIRAQVERFALNLAHVRQYGLPANPVKDSPYDRRAKAYIGRFGRASWEIESLDPVVLQNLIEQAILKHLDLELFEARQKLVTEGRRVLRKQALNQPLIVDLMKVDQPTLDRAATMRNQQRAQALRARLP